MKLNNKLKELYEKRPAIIAALLYVVIVLFFTFPLISRMGSEIPQGRGDTFQAMANIDSRLAAVSGLDFSGKMIFFAKNIGVYSPYVFLNLFFNKYVAYNILFLLSFVLSGVGSYLLAYYFTKNKYASFLAGLIFAFSPFHFYQSTVVNLGTMHQEWIPFMALFLFKFFEKLQLRHFLGFSFFAFLIAMNEHQMLAFSVLFIVAISIFKIASDKSIFKNKKFWIYVVCALGLLAFVAFFMFGDMLRVATSDNNFLDPGENAANKYSIKMLDPFMPPIFHSLWSGFSENLQKIFFGDSNRGSYFIGFSVLAMLVIFAFGIMRGRISEISDKVYRGNIAFWGYVLAIFYVFSLGNSFSVGSRNIYLPYYLIYKFLPFYENIRTTGRMFVFVMLAVSILFAYAFVQLLKKYSQKKLQMTAMFMAAVLLEFWVAPIRTMSVSYSAFYDKIANDNGQYKLIEIPGSTNYEFASYDLFLNTIAKKPVLNGMPLARKISGQFDMQQETPIIKQLLYTIPKGNDPQTKNMDDIIKGYDWNQAGDILNYYNVGYITISKVYADDAMRKMAADFIEKYVPYSDLYEDKYLIAYRVEKQVPTGLYTLLENDNNQFSDTFKSSNGSLQREVGDGAKLKIVNMENSPKKIFVSIKAQAAADLQFGLSGTSVVSDRKFVAGMNPADYAFELMLVPGENMIDFEVKDAAGKTVLIREKKKDPLRALVVSEITIEEK